MARQGLMDDSGYDFFDVSDCANYESCREDAFNDGYAKGASDMEKAKQIIIDALLKQLEVVKADAIDAFAKLIHKDLYQLNHHQVDFLAEQLKEQK